MKDNYKHQTCLIVSLLKLGVREALRPSQMHQPSIYFCLAVHFPGVGWERKTIFPWEGVQRLFSLVSEYSAIAEKWRGRRMKDGDRKACKY